MLGRWARADAHVWCHTLRSSRHPSTSPSHSGSTSSPQPPSAHFLLPCFAVYIPSALPALVYLLPRAPTYAPLHRVSIQVLHVQCRAKTRLWPTARPHTWYSTCTTAVHLRLHPACTPSMYAQSGPLQSIAARCSASDARRAQNLVLLGGNVRNRKARSQTPHFPIKSLPIQFSFKSEAHHTTVRTRTHGLRHAQGRPRPPRADASDGKRITTEQVHVSSVTIRATAKGLPPGHSSSSGSVHGHVVGSQRGQCPQSALHLAA